MLNIFYEISYLRIEYFVLLKKYSERKFPSWFSNELKGLNYKQKLAYITYLQTKSLITT